MLCNAPMYVCMHVCVATQQHIGKAFNVEVLGSLDVQQCCHSAGLTQEQLSTPLAYYFNAGLHEIACFQAAAMPYRLKPCLRTTYR